MSIAGTKSLGLTGAFVVSPVDGEVNTYADLPSAASNAGKFYLVKQASGAYILNRKPKGLYYSDGATWEAAPDIVPFFNCANTKFHDNADNTKLIDLDASNITTGNTRTIIMPDYDADLRYINQDVKSTASPTFDDLNIGGKIATGGEASPDVDDGGICLNQGANDAKILTLKSSDVAHGVTGYAETDTYTSLSKFNTSGGLELRCLNDAALKVGFWLTAIAGTEETDSAAGYGAVVLNPRRKSGTGTIAFSDTAVIFTIRNNTTNVLSVMGDGDTNVGGSIAIAKHAGFTQQTITYNSGTTTVDWGAGNKASLTFGAGNITTLAFTNPPKPSNLVLKIIQDGTGSRTITAWDTDIKWAGGSAPTLSTGASAIDIVSFYFDGTNYFGCASLNFS